MKTNERVIFETADVLVRQLSLEPLGSTPWHFHSEVVDHIYCLSGSIDVYCQNPDDHFPLKVGESCRVGIRRTHRVLNKNNESAVYLLVQGVGKYDFNVIDS
jgi:mannose-6-phosphate isomerase-like protein (cupin superfamily)